ncbi:DUF262 domain-containing protein [Roseburia sp. 1XD42-69]|uniref:DUF262 domain-containing protein n=1 Tax=Roseburia sp. 1XD42-69 TaxID=2320088 RepID=UPI000EA39AF0|nr:DUF262 domain-containing protein [Roseburia sp. 1XD42-69]RKJ68910.1 DUF262 domain-containing protein [Roseburia sp. 1XD42-69]
MDYTCRTKTLQALNKAMEKGTILLSHKLQRPEGQWNRKQKTDLIDSLLRKYPTNPTYGIKQDGVVSVIDGVQRLSCVRDFLGDKFALSKDMEPVLINDEEKSLAGLKFSKLDEDTKDIILSSELQIYELTDCTEKDVREIFRRQNAGKPLNAKQLRIVRESDEFSEIVYSLATHPFMDKLMTKAQRKNGTDRDLIIQTLMLIETNNENDFTSFRTKDIDVFVAYHSDSISQDKVDILKTAMDKFNEAFETIKVKQLNIPMILFASYRCVKDKKSFSKLIESITQFLSDYTDTEKLQDYKIFCQSGTSSTENVRGRLDYWRKIIREL